MEEAAVQRIVTEYETYVLDEWSRFVNDSARAAAALKAAEGLNVHRVLDIGCGCGQEILPFVEAGALGIGVDLHPETGTVRLIEEHGRAVFVRSQAEHLPFAGGSFDIIICRVALPYMANRLALTEMARTLRLGGRLLLKIHSARYYTHKLNDGIRRRDPLFAIHAVRVLVAGGLYHLTGTQVRKLISAETFQSEWLLRRELARIGLRITGYLPDHNPLTPSFIIEK